MQADMDGNGILDYEEFKVLLSAYVLPLKSACYSYISVVGSFISFVFEKIKCDLFVFWFFFIFTLQQRIWNAYSGQGEKVSEGVRGDSIFGTEQTIGFSIKNAVLFPTEVEKGLWPEDYSLSDHARLTVVFSPVRMPRSRVAL